MGDERGNQGSDGKGGIQRPSKDFWDGTNGGSASSWTSKNTTSGPPLPDVLVFSRFTCNSPYFPRRT